MNINTLTGILIPFAGTTLGAAMVFFMRKEMNENAAKTLAGICIRGYDCSICMVSSDSIDRDGRTRGRDCLGTGGRRLSFRNGIFAGVGYAYSTSSFYR